MQPVQCKHKIPANKVYFELISNYLKNLLKLSGYEGPVQDILFAFKSALNFTKVAAYNNESGRPIQVEFYLHHRRLEILIRDYGKQYDPAQTAFDGLDEFEESGLSWRILEDAMDSVRYTPHPAKGGELKMVKRYS